MVRNRRKKPKDEHSMESQPSRSGPNDLFDVHKKAPLPRPERSKEWEPAEVDKKVED